MAAASLGTAATLRRFARLISRLADSAEARQIRASSPDPGADRHGKGSSVGSRPATNDRIGEDPGTWRYVASRSRDETTGENVWEIRALYPAAGGGFTFTEAAIGASGQTQEELRRDVAQVLEDIELPS